MFMIRVAMGDVNFKIVPEASVFRGDADFEGPGAQKYHFWRKRPFWKLFFKLFSKQTFFFKNDISEPRDRQNKHRLEKLMPPEQF